MLNNELSTDFPSVEVEDGGIAKADPEMRKSKVKPKAKGKRKAKAKSRLKPPPGLVCRRDQHLRSLCIVLTICSCHLGK